MSLMLVAVAFASFSAAQASEAGSLGSGAELNSQTREASQGAANGEGADANGERRICRRIPTSGSHRYQRICLTAEQWRQQDN